MSLFSLICERRGVSMDALRNLFDERPVYIDGMDGFADFLRDHPDFVYTILSDFDSDGDNAAIIAFAGMSELGFKVRLYTPSAKDGYGFNSPDVIARLLQEFPDTDVIITCDNGIDCKEGISLAHLSGLQVIVTDHHIQKTDVGADLVIDPSSLFSQCEFKGVCGAYVIWKCLYHYAVVYGSAFMQEQIYRLRVFAGIATVTDGMPMIYENRKLVRETVVFCRMLLSDRFRDLSGCVVYMNVFLGLRVLLEELFQDKPSVTLDEDLFGFYIGPIFNAATKRIGESAFPVYRLFFGCFCQEDRQAAARELFRYNERRKKLVSDYMQKLATLEHPFAPYIYLTDAPAGILGLLATKFMDKSGMPTLVFGKSENGKRSCSGRSPEWFSFYDDAVSGIAKSLFVSVGGHAAAFGATAAESKLEDIYQYFCTRSQELSDELSSDLFSDLPDVVLGIDGDMELDLISLWEFYSEIESYRPYGPGFVKPDIGIRFRSGDVKWYSLGRYFDDDGVQKCRHMKAVFPNGFQILFWNQCFTVSELPDVLYCRGDFSVSEYDGMVSLQFAGVLQEEV